MLIAKRSLHAFEDLIVMKFCWHCQYCRRYVHVYLRYVYFAWVSVSLNRIDGNVETSPYVCTVTVIQRALAQ